MYKDKSNLTTVCTQLQIVILKWEHKVDTKVSRKCDIIRHIHVYEVKYFYKIV